MVCACTRHVNKGNLRGRLLDALQRHIDQYVIYSTARSGRNVPPVCIPSGLSVDRWVHCIHPGCVNEFPVYFVCCFTCVLCSISIRVLYGCIEVTGNDACVVAEWCMVDNPLALSVDFP